MTSTFFGLEISRRGLNVQRTAIDITGHNIANASTTGYSRQEAVIQASDPLTLPELAAKMQPGQLGTGVQADTVKRIRDYYLDVQYRQSSSNEGYWQKKLDNANDVEVVFPEPDGQGIQSTLTTFFNNWQDLNNNPQDSGVKTAVQESGDELASVLRQTYSQLEGVGTSISGAISDQVTQVNQLLTQIADVSNTIIYTIKNGAQPNDLLDKRDNLLDQLSSIAHINVDAQASGMINVTLIDSGAGATVLQDDGTGKVVASQVALITGAGADGDEDHLSVDGADVLNLTSLADYSTGSPEGAAQGTILGNESARLENKNLLDQINNLAVAIINNVNEKSGLPGSASSSTSAVQFYTGAGAADIALSDAIKNNPDDIIGDNALAVAQLQSTSLSIGTDTSTLASYYQAIVAQVGADVSTASNMLDNQKAITQQVNSLKQSVSGVSLDEELTKIIQFQSGYQASARMISIQNDMLDYLINKMQ